MANRGPRPLARTRCGINNTVVRAGDCVLMKAWEEHLYAYVGRVVSIEVVDWNETVKVGVRWYYLPEETLGGRAEFHGRREVFWSDHFDRQFADTILGTCIVHSFQDYTELDVLRPTDYYCRFEYQYGTGNFIPDPETLPRYCRCEQPNNPDRAMIRCDVCNMWYHFDCENLTEEQVRHMVHFVCSEHGDGDYDDDYDYDYDDDDDTYDDDA